MSFRSLMSGVAVLGFTLWALPAMAATPLTVTEFGSVAADAITAGPGGIWFLSDNNFGRISTSGTVQNLGSVSSVIFPFAFVLGSDGNIWIPIMASPTGEVDQIDPTGAVIGTFPLDPGLFADGIANGPDGNLWVTDFDGPAIIRVTTAGAVTEFTPTNSALPPSSRPSDITAGPDGNIWFTDQRSIGRVTPEGAITEFSNGITAESFPAGITAGPDGAVWFVETTPIIGRIAPDGSITEFPYGPSSTRFMTGLNIATGPDRNLWFTGGNGPGTGFIGRITPAGVATIFTSAQVPSLGSNAAPADIVPGPDGNLWFTDAGAIGRLVLPTDEILIQLAGTGAGTVTSARAPGVASVPNAPNAISCASADGGGTCAALFLDATTVTLTASGAAGSVFTGWSGGSCSGIAPCAVSLAGNQDSTVTANFALVPVPAALSITTSGAGTVASAPSGISCGSTCTASFASGTTVTLTAAPAAGFTFAGWSGGGCAGVETCSVTLGADTTVTANFMAQSASDIILVSSLLPTSRSVEVGATATVFAALVNASPDTAGTLCQIQPATAVPADFFFQTTDPATNHLVGTRNAPVTIPPGNAFQTFILGFTPSAEIAPTNIAFNFTCANAPAAASQTGLNTMLLSASTTPTPDIVALSATVNDDGIVHIPSAAGVGVFAVATANVGAASTLTVSANVGAANLPVSLALCQTVPATGQCMAAPTPSVTTAIGAGETPSFGIFVQGSGTVAAQPAANRVFVQFTDAGGAVRGSTSVAVQTK